MTTGATGQLGLALPVQGELSGTWGDTVNNGITQYTNIAIAGTLTLTGDGAVTLANTTGDASASNITSTLAGAGTVTAQFAIVKVSGTTTTKVVTGPSYSKTYVVDNASSYAVTFKASGQTGVSVAAAEKVTVVFNGTDYIKLAGTIANAAGSNTQIQFNNGGLFGASANLTWDGTTLSSTQVNITGQGTLRLQDTTGGEYVGLRSPSALGASYTLTFPADDGTSGQALITDGSGGLSWSTSASGDVYGPGSSTDNAVARFDSTTGKLLQNSVVIIGDTGDVTGVGTLSAATLTLTNALGTAYGGTGLTSFTSGGVVYASSSSALATGANLTFNGNTLTSSNATGANVIFNSTANTPYVSFAESGASKLLIGASAVVAGGAGYDFYGTSGIGLTFYTNAAERLRITSAGNVGIGSSSPSAKLTVDNGSIQADTAGVATGRFGSSTYITTGTGTDLVIQAVDSASSTIFYRGGTEQGRFSSTGNFGIGTSSPTEKLVVNGNARLLGGGYLQLFNSTNASNSGLATDATGLLQFSSTSVTRWLNNTLAVEQMRLDSAGNLGLGVTPSAWDTLTALQVKNASLAAFGNSTYLYSNAYYQTAIGNRYISNGFATRYTQGSGKHIWETAPSSTANATATFTEAMTLDASGALIVGTTTAQGEKATFQSSTISSANIGIVQIRSTKAADSGDCLLAIVKQANDDSTSQVFVRFGINGYAQGCGQINANGASQAAFGSFSDYRLKENIESLPSQLSNIMALRPVEFDYKNGSGHQVGFIAQEMEQVYPDAIGVGEDEMLTITGWSKTEARLVKAIQEQQAIIESLKARLDAANL